MTLDSSRWSSLGKMERNIQSNTSIVVTSIPYPYRPDINTFIAVEVKILLYYISMTPIHIILTHTREQYNSNSKSWAIEIYLEQRAIQVQHEIICNTIPTKCSVHYNSNSRECNVIIALRVQLKKCVTYRLMTFVQITNMSQPVIYTEFNTRAESAIRPPLEEGGGARNI